MVKFICFGVLVTTAFNMGAIMLGLLTFKDASTIFAVLAIFAFIAAMLLR